MPVKFTHRFSEHYLKLPAEIRLKVKKALGLLDADFRHPGVRSHPVEGGPGIFEAYADDKYRMTFMRQGKLFLMRNVANHDECLKNP